MKNNKVAVYPGSFDPPTNGHIDIITRASKIFPEVIVAITENYNKHHMFSIQERVVMMKESVAKIKNVKVDSFSGLLTDYVTKIDGCFVIRGLRALSDFESEFQMALMNRKLNREVQSVFLMTGSRWIFTSSSIIKEVARYGGDISDMVPKLVERRVKEKFETLVKSQEWQKRYK